MILCQGWSTLNPLVSTHPDAHELSVSVIVSTWCPDAEHGGELGDVVDHSEAGVSGPLDAGETPELTVPELGDRDEI